MFNYYFLDVTKAYYKYCLYELLKVFGMYHKLTRILQKCKITILKV